MKVFKRILVIFLCICLLTTSISYRVKAAEIAIGAGLTAKTIFDICLFVGGALAAGYAVGEVVDNKEDIARAGKEFIDSVKEIPEGWILSLTDASGQEYVFGSEALELVRDTPWTVIQGGASNNNDDNNNNDDDKNKGWLNIFSPENEMVGSFLALGATWFAEESSDLYKKKLNMEKLTDSEQAVFDALLAGTCDQNDVAAQWSGEPFDYTANVQFITDWDLSSGHYIQTDIYNVSGTSIRPVCAYIDKTWAPKEEAIRFLCLNAYEQVVSFNMSGPNYQKRVYDNGRIEEKHMTQNSNNVSSSMYPIATYSANFPIFSSKIEAENYLKGTAPVTDALNYAKTYQIADWLQDDWKGLIIDPFTNIGLTLTQLIDLAKALGLHAIGNNISAQELLDLLKAFLPAVDPDLWPDGIPDPSINPNPDLDPDKVPVPSIKPDPDLDPIYWPSADAHPLPDVDPGTKPGDNTDPGGNIDPDPDVDVNDYKIDLRGLFPFCIPFDFVALLNVLDADPVAPCFSFPVVIPALDYEETVQLDMSIFDDVAEVMRVCEKVSFVIFLMFSTSKVIRW